MGYDLANEILADIMQAEVWKRFAWLNLKGWVQKGDERILEWSQVVTVMSGGDPSTPRCKGNPRETTRPDQLIPQLTGRFLS